MRTMRIWGALIVGAGLLFAAGQTEAEWQYTDAKGKTRTVMLKMDVPGEYRNTAVYVDLGNLNRPPTAVAPLPYRCPRRRTLSEVVNDTRSPPSSSVLRCRICEEHPAAATATIKVVNSQFQPELAIRLVLRLIRPTLLRCLDRSAGRQALGRFE